MEQTSVKNTQLDAANSVATQNSSSSQTQRERDVTEQILKSQLDEISNLCSEIGATDGKGGAQKKSDHNSTQGVNKPGVSKKEENNLIHHGPIYLALLVVLFTGQDSSYHVLAGDMANMSKLLKKIQKLTKDNTEINDDLNKIMKGEGNPEQLAHDIADLQNRLMKLSGSKGISKSLSNSIKDLVKPGGKLDQIVVAATKNSKNPCSSWASAANNPDALKAIKDYMCGTKGGPAGKAATDALSSISNLLGSLNTQNQADVQELNLMNKKVDSDTKLFASSITMYKGLIQTLTNYSGS